MGANNYSNTLKGILEAAFVIEFIFCIMSVMLERVHAVFSLNAK